MHLWSYSRDQTEEEYNLKSSTSLPFLFSFTFLNLSSEILSNLPA